MGKRLRQADGSVDVLGILICLPVWEGGLLWDKGPSWWRPFLEQAVFGFFDSDYCSSGLELCPPSRSGGGEGAFSLEDFGVFHC